MVYFIRRFVSGIKGSGTSDIWTDEEPMTDEDFHNFARIYGEGKYLLCVRGKGIKGFRKLAETIVEPKVRVFRAEDTVSVSADVNVKNLSNEQLLGVLEQNAEGEDFSSMLDELQKRLDSVQTNNADEVLASAGFPIGSKIASFMVGALTGGVVVYLIHKKKIDALNDEIASLKNTVKQAEEAIKKVEKKTEELSQPMTFEQQLLNSFNSMNGVRL
jgi:tetrahydromethanopterin S-methyltransferase subunit B